MSAPLQTKGKSKFREELESDGEKEVRQSVASFVNAPSQPAINEADEGVARNVKKSKSFKASKTCFPKLDGDWPRKNSPSFSSASTHQSEVAAEDRFAVEEAYSKSLYHPNSPYSQAYQEEEQTVEDTEMRLTRPRSVMNPSAWADVDIERDAGIGAGRRVRGVMFSEESFDEYTSATEGCERRYTLKRVERPLPVALAPVNGQRIAGVELVAMPSSSRAAPVITGPSRGKPMAGFEFGEPPAAGGNPYSSTANTATTDPAHSTATLLRHPSHQTYTVTITTNHDLPLAEHPDLYSTNPLRRFLARTRLRRAARQRELILQAGLPEQQNGPRMERWRKMAVVIGIVIVIAVSTAIAGALVATTSLKGRPYGQFRGEIYPGRNY